MTDEERSELAEAFCSGLVEAVPFRHVPRVEVPEGCTCDICEPKVKREQ